MSQSSSSAFVGFPPPLLGDTPCRLPILAQGADWVCLNKPGRVGMREHPWDPSVPDLDTALNLQLKAGKPELLRLQADMFGSAYYLDPGISGLALFAKNRSGLEFLRNQYGSMAMKFRFIFVAPHFSGELDEGFEATAPLLPHNTKPKMIPSTAKGKKSTTLFKCLETASAGWSLWEARTDFFRVHQVRAHFSLSGVGILGDEVYGQVAVPLLRDFTPKKRGGSGLNTPVFEGLALHLAEICFTDSNSSLTTVKAPLPRTFSVMLKRIHLSLSA